MQTIKDNTHSGYAQFKCHHSCLYNDSFTLGAHRLGMLSLTDMEFSASMRAVLLLFILWKNFMKIVEL